MSQKKVTRKELKAMRVGQTRVFILEDEGKLQSVATTANQMKNNGDGIWEVGKDRISMGVSVKRLK